MTTNVLDCSYDLRVNGKGIIYLKICLYGSTRTRELDALYLLYFGCRVIVNVLWLFLTVTWVGLQFVIVVFPDHTHLLFQIEKLTFCIELDTSEVHLF